MSEKITIEATNESISEAIKAGVTSPELVDSWLGTAAELVEDAVVINLTTWGARDSGGGEIEVECDTAQEAAQEFVDGGEWGENKETFWVNVRVWRNGVNARGAIVAVDEETITIEVAPIEPECSHEDGHDWQSPHSIVGGCKENPGVYGSGGGVIITQVCMHCGCGQHTDTWAQNSENGQQGLTSVKYVLGEFSEAVESESETADE